MQRLNSQLRGALLPADIQPVYSVDTAAITSWVAQTATQNRSQTDQPKRTPVFAKYSFKIRKSVKGAQGQSGDGRGPRLPSPVGRRGPLLGGPRCGSAGQDSQAQDRRVELQERHLRVAEQVSHLISYRGAKLVKSYPCAPGRPAYPTPTGNFHIQSKQANASWINPGDAWAASMPAVIGPGPSNPMGVRKIGINYPGVFMHGVPGGEFGSIGTHASHGCMRMFPSDVLDLYGRVKIGDPVTSGTDATRVRRESYTSSPSGGPVAWTTSSLPMTMLPSHDIP